MSYFVICRHCKTDCLYDGPGDSCIFCDHDPITGQEIKKEDIKVMVVEIPRGDETRERPKQEALGVVATASDPGVPPKPRSRKERGKYYDRHMTDVLADYQSMKLLDFFKRWGISSGMWKKLKQRWGVNGKYKSKRPVATPRYREKDGNITEAKVAEDTASASVETIQAIGVEVGKYRKLVERLEAAEQMVAYLEGYYAGVQDMLGRKGEK